MSEINPTDHKSITAADTTQPPTFREIISWLRLTFRSRESMDLGNAIIVCIMFGAWIRKIRRTSLKGFGIIRQKILHCYFLLNRLMFHNENLAGKQDSFSPSSCCLQGIRFPGVERGGLVFSVLFDELDVPLAAGSLALLPPPPARGCSVRRQGEEVDGRVCGIPFDIPSPPGGLHCLIIARQTQKA